MGKKTRYITLSAMLFSVTLSGCYSEFTETSGNVTPIVLTSIPPMPALVQEFIDTKTRQRDGMTMLYVPAGQFQMGSGDAYLNQALQACADKQGEDVDCLEQVCAQAQPVHKVMLDAFWIDQTEVTNAMYTAFLNEEGNQSEQGVSWLEPGEGHRGIVYGHIIERNNEYYPKPDYEDYPAIEVSWYGAAAYCHWVGGRLPTEAEWEYTARGPQNHVYPWGEQFNGTLVNYCDATCRESWRDDNFSDGESKWGSVGRYSDGRSWCGALDMAGNVWEWVSDWWSSNYYAHSPADNPRGPETGNLRIARGGSWYEESWRVSPSCRKALTPSSYRMHWIGFRCAMDTELLD